MSELEQRIKRLEDRAELQELAIRYFKSADDDDWDGLAACFASDASFNAGGFPGGSTREEVIAFLKADRATMGATVHTFNSMLLEFDGDDSATGLIAAHLELARGGTTIFGAARYHDKFVKRDGRWQILALELRTLHVGPWAQVSDSLTSELPVRWPGIEPVASER
jgi:SnoaL-like domain